MPLWKKIENSSNSNIFHVLVTDADESPNASPFTFDIRAGNEENSFRVVQDGTLRTATKFNHKVRNKYQLQIRAFDNGSPPLFSDVWVHVSIIEESQYPPIVVPMKVNFRYYNFTKHVYECNYLCQNYLIIQNDHHFLTINLRISAQMLR